MPPPTPASAVLSDSRASFPFLRPTSGALLARASPAVPQALLWSPYARATLARARGAPVRCDACGAVCVGDACDLCGRQSEEVGEFAAGGRDDLAVGDTVEYNVRGVGGAVRGAVVVVIDENVGGAKVMEIVEAVRAVYSAARESRFMLLSYGVGVSVAVLGGGVVGSQKVVLDVVTEDGAQGMETGRKAVYFAPGADNLFGDGGQEGGVRVVEMDRFLGKVLDAAVIGGVGDGLEDVVLEADEGQRAGVQKPVEQRRLDAAIEVALALMDGVVDTDASRILCFVGGVPTLEEEKVIVEPRDVTVVDIGDDGMAGGRLPRRGSVVGLLEEENSEPVSREPAGWFDTISSGFGLFSVAENSEASEGPSDGPVGDDVTSGGASYDLDDPPPGMVRLLSRHEQQKADKEIAAAHSKLTATFERLGTLAGEARVPLHFLIFDSGCGVEAKVLHGAAFGSKGGMVVAPPHGWPAKRSLAKSAAWLAAGIETRPGLVNVRVSAPYKVKRFIGPASVTAAPYTFTVANADPGIGFVVVLESEDDVGKEAGLEEESEEDCVTAILPAPPQNFVVVQLAATSLGTTRVTTVRIPVVADSKHYWKTVDPEATAIVLGKLAIADAGGSAANSYRAAAQLDNAARKLLSVHPPPVHIASMLYYMRRGPLVEAYDGISEDASLALRLRFQCSDAALSVLMAAPRAFSTRTGAAEMVEASATTAIVEDEASAVVLDAGATVFVWLGGEVPSSVERGVVAAATEVAESRGLTNLHVVRSGDENEVVLLTPYLVPKSEEGDVRRGEKCTSLSDVKYMSFVEYVAMTRKAMRAASNHKS